MRKWTHIILHHSLTEDGPTVSWQAIRNYHVNTLGWRDVGYHWGVEWIHRGYEVLMGRPMDQDGAHTRGMNDRAIGICVTGNFDVQTPVSAMFARLVPLLRFLSDVFEIPVDNIEGHRDYASKSCPGKNFSVELVRKLVKEGG